MGGAGAECVRYWCGHVEGSLQNAAMDVNEKEEALLYEVQQQMRPADAYRDVEAKTKFSYRPDLALPTLRSPTLPHHRAFPSRRTSSHDSRV